MSLYRFDIPVRLSAAEVRARIQSLIGRVDRGQAWRVHTAAKEFKLYREPSDSDEGNDFSPWIRGRVREHSSGCTVRVSMGLQPFVAVFMTAWLGLTGGAALWQLSVERRPHIAGGPALMFGLGLLITLAGFYVPARRMRARLVDLLTGSGCRSASRHIS